MKYYQQEFGELPIPGIKMRLFENDEITGSLGAIRRPHPFAAEVDSN